MIKAQIGDTVAVHFICKFKNGLIYDSSCGKEPLQFTIGSKEIISNLEQAVVGMFVGESKTISIPAEEAFGPYRKELISHINRAILPPGVKPEIGQQFEIQSLNGAKSIAQIVSINGW